MFDAQMSFAGFEPESCTPLVWAPALAKAMPAPTPLAAETAAYLHSANNAKVWPRVPTKLWERSFSPLERAKLNLDALTEASSLSGQAPSGGQREILNLFNGWGALSALFKPGLSAAWKSIHDNLAALVGTDGMTSIRAATTTSFFTPPALVRAMWDGLAALGFKGGNILDPSAGHGMFIGQMPEAMAKRSQVTAIEPDKATASVLRALYAPHGVNVIEGTFEGVSLPDEFFDAVVTNVPFGDFGVPERRNVAFRNFRIHDYFLARALEVVRPGGLVAVITSAGTLDKISGKARPYLATQGRLLGAFRLPVEAFEQFAGTEPVTDVLVFQRCEPGRVTPNPDDWVDTGIWRCESGVLPYAYQRQYNGIPINARFVRCPEDVLGEVGVTSGQYGYQSTVSSKGDWLSALQQRLSLLPPDAYQQTAARRRAQTTVAVDTSLQPGSFMVNDEGRICVVESALTATTVEGLNLTSRQRILGMMEVRDAVKALLAAQVETASDEALPALRSRLNVAYDTFVRKHGALNATANVRAFAGDPAATLLQSIEVENPKGHYGKAEIFHSRTVNARLEITHCDSASEALKASLAVRGDVDVNWIGELTGRECGAVMAELAESGLVFCDPKTSTWVEAGAYLSGNVRQKLREAELAGESWATNAEALRAVVPDDLSPADIHACLGATWVSVDDYKAFVTEVFGVSSEVTFDAITGSWSVQSTEEYRIPVNIRGDFGVSGYLTPIDLMQKAMNRQQPTVTDADPTDRKKRLVNQVKTIEAREKQGALEDRFREWLWSDDARSATLARKYNDTFNSVVNRTFDGSHLVLPGFSRCFIPHQHQKDAVWRIITQPTNALLAHQVGFGKSLEMVAAGMELKRLGVASKIAYVVPNATLGSFVQEFVRAYPAANLLVATEKDFAGDNRRRFLARAATGNWDGGVIAHSSFERIQLSPEYTEEFIADEVARIEAAIKANGDTRSQSVKQLERAKRQWEARLAKTANAKGDTKDCLAFDQIGFDWIMLDEAHYFKNLYRFSKMERVAGLPDSNSERAFDMFLKCGVVTAKHGGQRGVVFATGTPVANSIGELYTMQRFLQESALVRCGMASFDAWASNFGEIVTGLEIAPDGSGYRMNRRFSRFVNIPELMALFRQVADIKVGNMPCLKLPVAQREVVTATASDALKAFVASLVERAEAIRNGLVSPKDDNMLAVTNDGRKAAMDMRLVDRCNADDPDGKVNQCVRNVHAIWQETAAERLTQVVFSDLGTPNSEGRFSVYDDVRTKLLQAGVPQGEIAFAHDASTHAARAKMDQDVRDGVIRIVIGSTQKLGVGRNMQDKLVALHHLDAPWRPADIEQREGRIVRQNNTNPSVRIFRYVTAGSFDAYMWQTLETKAKFIAQIMTGESAVRTAEDLEMAALSYSEVKALASGNPMVIEKAGVDAEVAKLSVMKAAHADTVARAKRAISDLPKRLASISRRVAGIGQMVEEMEAMGRPVVVANGKSFADSQSIGQLIHATAKHYLYVGAKPVEVGMIGSLKLMVLKKSWGDGYMLVLQGAEQLSRSYDGAAIAAANAFSALCDVATLKGELVMLGDEAANTQRRLEESRFEAVRPFAQEARFREVLERQAQIDGSLETTCGVIGEAEAA